MLILTLISAACVIAALEIFKERDIPAYPPGRGDNLRVASMGG